MSSREHGANAYSVKTYSYQYFENTYAIKKFARRHIKTAAFTFHDTPSDVTSTPGLPGMQVSTTSVRPTRTGGMRMS